MSFPGESVEVLGLHRNGADDVVADPTRGMGQPVFAPGGARLEDAHNPFRAGESLETVAAEYGVPLAQLEDALHLAARIAA